MKPVNFLSVCCNTIKLVQKKHQGYELEKEIVRDTHFLRLNFNDSYNHNMTLVDLIDQLQSVYQVDQWMCKCKWLWYLLFWVHGLVLANVYIIFFYVKRSR